MRTANLPHLAARLFDSPLMIHRGKLDVIMSVLGPRLEGEGPAAFPEGEQDERSREVTREKRVASIPVLGTLVHRKLGMAAMSGMDSTQQLRARIEAAVEDSSVDGILLEIDSPGGEVAGIFDLGDVIHAAREKKPVVAFVNEWAMSAGYLIASAADSIVLPRTGAVGSIGIVAMHVDQSSLNEKVGIKPEFIFAGDKKVDGNPHAPLKDSARATIQADVDKAMSIFVESVARNRGISTEAVRATQAGKFSGSDAVDEGLADIVGGKAEAIAELNRMIEAREEENMNAEAFETLEAEHKAALAENAQLKATLEEQGKALAAFREEQAAFVKKQNADYVAGIVNECIAAGATPPEKADQDKIMTALESSQELGKLVGESVRDCCLAKHRSAATETVTLETGKTEDAKEQASVVSSLLKIANLSDKE